MSDKRTSNEYTGKYVTDEKNRALFLLSEEYVLERDVVDKECSFTYEDANFRVVCIT